MMHQYIGARYVPRFMDTYDITQIYEALDVVDNGSGTSYIARKPVPAGTPLTDSEYWAVYGASSGAIINLQNQINDIYSRINNNFWHNKKVCVYGDSLSDPLLTHNYWQYLAAMDDTIDITNKAQGGESIGNAKTKLASATDIADYDVIVLAYGTNTWQMSLSIDDALSDYIDCFNRIHTVSPTTQIMCIVPYFSYKPDFGISGVNGKGYNLYMYNKAVGVLCENYGGIFVDLMEIAGVDRYNYTTLVENSSGNYFHEGEILGRRIARLLFNENWSGGNTDGIVVIPKDSSSGLFITRTENGYRIRSYGTITTTWLNDQNVVEYKSGMVGFGSFIVGMSVSQAAGYIVLTTSGSWAIRWFTANTDSDIAGIDIETVKTPFMNPVS